jgi:sulfur relay (sulfurtransferase) DsrF/TusC family protein
MSLTKDLEGLCSAGNKILQRPFESLKDVTASLSMSLNTSLLNVSHAVLALSDTQADKFAILNYTKYMNNMDYLTNYSTR